MLRVLLLSLPGEQEEGCGLVFPIFQSPFGNEKGLDLPEELHFALHKAYEYLTVSKNNHLRWRGSVGKLFLILALGTLLFPGIGFAAPASPELHELVQPDGTTFLARQWGDERLHGWETEDGYTILFDEHLGAWVYAQADNDGSLVSSGKVLNTAMPDETSKGLRPAGKAIKKVLRRRGALTKAGILAKTVPSTGTGKIPVILMNFHDTIQTKTVANFNGLFFDTGTHSLSDYYEEVSYGKFKVTGKVRGWYDASKNHDYYGANDASGNDLHPAELVQEAAEAADTAGFNFAGYVSGPDCQVDVLVVVHEGTGEESSAMASDIWSEQSSLVEKGLSPYVTKSSCLSDPSKQVIVNNYLIIPEVSPGGSLTTIGVPTHEYAHALGLPDLYDSTYKSKGIGNWSLMAGGLYNKVAKAGDRPAHLDAWSKYFLGWVVPTDIASTSCQSVKLVETNPQVYKLLSGTPLSGEYFLVENRQLTGFDQALPGSGLLIWHIDGNKINQTIAANTVETSPCIPSNTACADHYGVALVQADGDWGLERNSDSGDGLDAFFSPRATELTPDSNPNSYLYNVTDSHVSISDIGPSGIKMTALLSASPTAISVQSPKTGDKFAKGGTVDILWKYDGDPGDTVSIELDKGGTFLKIIGAAAIGDCGEGSSQWTVPVDPDPALGNDYTIKVTSSSNSLFTNVSGQFSITEDLTVIAPASGVIWPAGTQQTISWTYLGNPGPSMKIDLYKGGVHSATIGTASSGKGGNGSYTWKVPGSLKPGADYQVKVSSPSAKYSNYTDISSFFTVPQPLTITSPSGGETWAQGSQHTISWSYAGNPGPSVNIYLYNNGTLSGTLATKAPFGSGGTGSFTWTVPTTQSTGTGYTIKIISPTNTTFVDTSSPFSIVKPTVTWQKTIPDGTVNSVQQTSDGGYVLAVSGVVMKLDVSGNVQWKTTGTHYEGFSYVVETSDGGYIAASSDSNQDWVVRLDATGTILWEKSFCGVAGGGTTGAGTINGIQKTADGGFILAGTTWMEPPAYDYTYVAWVYKLDQSGALEWSNTYGKNLGLNTPIPDGGGYSEPFYFGESGAVSVQQTSDGGYVASGYNCTPNYTPGINDGCEESGGAVFKLDPGGNLEWEQIYDTYNTIFSIRQTSDGGYVTAELAPTLTSMAIPFLVSKLDAGGNLQWNVTTTAAPYTGYNGGAAPTSDGGYIVAGVTTSPAASLSKLDGTGNILWQRLQCSPDYGYFTSVQQTTDGGYIAAGADCSAPTAGCIGLVVKFDANGNFQKSQ
jgi:M6 family metalloprotease-like protein